MSRPKLKRPSPGTVLGLLALIVALAGNANAFSGGTKVRKGDIAKGAVTAKALAAGAVGTKALAKNAVTSKALRQDSVTARALAADSVAGQAIKAGSVGATALAPAAVSATALAPNAVTSRALAPGSVYGGSLGPVATYSAPLADQDETADLSTWTTSGTETVECPPGERLLTGGIRFTNPGNRRVGVVRALPFSTVVDGFSGEITSDSGGTATAEVVAICLK